MRMNTAAKANTTDKITTFRLPQDTRNRLVAFARAKNKTKSQVIIESLEMFFDREENELDSYTLGLPYFGKYSSGIGDLSITYKERIREKLRARQNTY